MKVKAFRFHLFCFVFLWFSFPRIVCKPNRFIDWDCIFLFRYYERNRKSVKLFITQASMDTTTSFPNTTHDSYHTFSFDSFSINQLIIYPEQYFTCIVDPNQSKLIGHIWKKKETDGKELTTTIHSEAGTFTHTHTT